MNRTEATVFAREAVSNHLSAAGRTNRFSEERDRLVIELAQHGYGFDPTWYAHPSDVPMMDAPETNPDEASVLWVQNGATLWIDGRPVEGYYWTLNDAAVWLAHHGVPLPITWEHLHGGYRALVHV